MATFSVHVINDERVMRRLRRAAFKVADLMPAWQRIQRAIEAHAITLTPVLTGRLVKSIRTGNQKRAAVVRAGNKGLVYAPIQHYGGYNNIQGKYFLTIALYAKEDYANEQVENELDRIIRRVGLT